MPVIPPEIIKAAQESQRATKVPACISIAQWALESNWGKELSAPYNYFGIKWYPGNPRPFKARGTKEQTKNGTEFRITAKFVVFANLTDAFTFHGRLLASPTGPYRSALPFITDWFAYLKKIAPIYATDRNYATKLISIINSNQLYKYNSFI